MRTPEEIGESMKDIIRAMNSISIEELDEVLGAGHREEALGPMLDSTAYQRGMFEANRQTKKVLEAIRNFKVEVSGIGNFATA